MFKKQMGSAVLALIGVFAVFISLAITVLIIYVNAANFGNRSEVEIKKVWENNQNVLGQYTLKVQEIASVPEMYKNDLKEVMTSVMTARMGTEGSKATFQFFKEHNINVDSTMYTKIQQVVEAGRNEFQNNQTRLIDIKGAYETALGSIPRGWFLSFAGYPKITLADYKPVVAGDTRQVFQQGVQAPIQMRPTAK